MKFGIVIFPGTNCDRDTFYLLRKMGEEVRYLWHKETHLLGIDCIILPGGFSYGDYLRCGAVARFSPIMKEVVSFADRGGRVLGICNGFQILTECGLLPGALMRNANLQFICETVELRIENNQSLFTKHYSLNSVVKMPVAHNEGNYFADEETLDRLEGEGRILFRYSPVNPNGSRRDIAGIINERGNVMGLMPHPERCAERLLGNEDGRGVFESLLC